MMEGEGVYEERFVSFLDILGFRSIVEDPSLALAIKTALKNVELLKDQPPSRLEPIKTMVAFSDCIVMSSDSALDLKEATLGLQRNFLVLGLMSRGGFTFGPVYHEKQIVFGPAMIEAYDIERKTAKNPRVIVSESARQKLSGQICDAAIPDEDGLYYFHPLVDWLALKNSEIAENLRRTLKQLEEKAGEDLHKERVQWMRKRFEEAIKIHKPELERE